MSYGSWAICGPSMQLNSVKERVLAMENAVEGRGNGVPIYIGTLEEFAKEWKGKFTVHPIGAYITL